MAISMVWMRLRRRHVSTRAVLAIYIFAVPVGLAAVAYQIFLDQANLQAIYWIYVVSWAALCVLGNLVNVFTFKFASLTEISTYRLMASTLIAFCADYFFFQINLSVPLIIFVTVALFGGVLLNKERNQFISEETSTDTSLPFYQLIALSIVVSLLLVAELAVLKKALEVQNNFVFHAAAAQSILFMMFFMHGGFSMKRAFEEKKVQILEILLITIFIIFAVLLEAFSYIALPVVIIVLLSVFQPLVFSIHDFWTKDMPLNKKSVAACLMIVMGILGVSTIQNGIW